MSDDLVEFITARLAEDERHARAAGWHRWEVGDMTTVVATGNGKVVAGVGFDYDARFIARHDPARILREVAAHRRILDEYAEALEALDGRDEPDPDPYSRGWADWYCMALEPVVRLLAAPYSDHPGFRSEWLIEEHHG